MDEEKAKKKFGGGEEEGKAITAWMKKQREGDKDKESPKEEKPKEK